MNRESTLEFIPYEEGKYVLKNKTMDTALFVEKIKQLEKVCNEIYTVSSENILKVGNIDNEAVLFVDEQRVRNIVKALVLTPSSNISVVVTKRNNETRTFTSKDFGQNISQSNTSNPMKR